MANIQKQFDKFDEVIKLGRFDENATLREKRDIIKNKLVERLPIVFKEAGEECPSYYFRDQGSYEMGTGAKPLRGDYDIDQGLYFKVSVKAYPDPVTLKQRVFDALDGHTDNVCIRRSCVTVFYHNEGESIYHVDFAVYSDGASNSDGKARIAKGKANSLPNNRFWEPSNPQALTDLIESRFKDNDRTQFRRIIRILKRWKDNTFTTGGNAAPIGIGLTVAAYYDLQNCYSDIVAGKPDDLTALKNLVSNIIGRFTTTWDAAKQVFVRRLKITLPVEPWNDLFEKMTDKQMEDFEARLKSLNECADIAAKEVDPVEACKVLAKLFGEDFPVPPREETAKRHAPAIVSSSSSA